jgi:nucleoside-diphosphate-sugar epimerase
VVVRQLLQAGHAVRVLDRLTFGEQSLSALRAVPGFSLMVADLRDPGIAEVATQGCDAVVHLAAIVGDAACRKYEDEATAIMRDASQQLYQVALAQGVRQFVFASTCSNYGVMGEGEPPLKEDAPLRPQSHYARLKTKFEEYLLAQQDAMATTLLRFATVYGVSPRMRFDLLVNHFSRDLCLGREVTVLGRGGWRPFCHVSDLSRSVELSLRGSSQAGERRIYNVGDSEENYTKEMIVQTILRRAPKGVARYVEEGEADPRNYRVDFSRIQRELGFRIRFRVPDGVEEVIHLVKTGALDDPFDPIYVNA